MATVGVVLALSAVADLGAVLILRGDGWARWVLIALAVVAGLSGVMLAYYVVPLLMTVAAAAVTVLLLVPDARVWFHTARGASRAATV